MLLLHGQQPFSLISWARRVSLARGRVHVTPEVFSKVCLLRPHAQGIEHGSMFRQYTLGLQAPERANWVHVYISDRLG